MLGKKRELLPQHFLEEIGGETALAELQFTPERLTPICNFLKHIISGGCLNRVFCSSAASVAFILRHIRQLETWEDSKQDLEINLNIFVQLLHATAAVDYRRKRFKRQSISSVELGLIQWRMNVPFFGIY